MQFTEAHAQAIAQSIVNNVADVDNKRIDWGTFSARNIALWKSVDMGEPRVHGSACDTRISMVEKAMRAL